MDQEKYYENIQNLLDKLPDNFSILEEEINIDLQMEYFEKSKSVRENNEGEDALDNKDLLFLDTTSIDDKKDLLSKIASLGTIDSYRILEKYCENPDLELKEWGILALNETKLTLESRLLDENQVFISTGLGGKGDKLRYFMVFLTRKGAFTDVQKKIFKNELDYGASRYNCEVETLEFDEELAVITVLMPIKSNIKEVYREIIAECNQFGDFLHENFLVTNVKKLSYEEIRKFINNQGKDKDRPLQS